MHRFVVAVLLIASISAGVGLAYQKRPDERPEYRPAGAGETYLALGDSLAAGFTVGDPAEAYVARIHAALRRERPAIGIRNFAVPGETSSSFLRGQLPVALELIAAERAAGRRVSPITLDIGGNDARAAEPLDRAGRAEALRRVEENLGHALDALLEATRDSSGEPGADLVVMSYYNPFGGDPADDMSAAYWTNQLNLAIMRAASTRGVPVADVGGAFSGGLVYRYTYITAGDIHANADGHQIIAEQFWRALQYSGTIAPQQ
jgi:lysophospholipase L1-like esterase